MEILNYTEKSFVLFGEKSKEVKEELKQLGGRFNPNLTHPETKEKLSAWVFSKKALEKVQKFIQSGEIDSSSVVPKKKVSTTKKKPILHDPVDEIVDPISRLGLKDNGPDPVKKTKKSTKLVPTKEITRVVVPYRNQNEFQYKQEQIELEENSSSTPEIKTIPSFSMIIPKVGMKVHMKDKQENEFYFKVSKTIPDLDGYIFEFEAVTENIPEDENDSVSSEPIHFVMVGRQWRILSTLSPEWMNLIQ